MRSLLVLASGAAALSSGKPNPIRKVVTLLQEMQEEIENEIEKEKKQWEKFQCYCKKNDGDLGAKAAEAAALIKKTQAEVEANTAQKKELHEQIKKHKKDRADAEKNLADATKQRNEEKAKYEEATKEQRKTLDDIDRAIAALEKGMGKAFLQTGAADVLRNVLTSNSAVMNGLEVSDQQTLMSFLQNKKDYAPASGEIVGILKMMKDNFDESLGGIIGEEEAAVAAFAKLKVTLEDLIKTSGRAIEKKTELKGQTAVKIVEGKNLISTTEKQMGDDMATLARLKEACSGKGEEFATRQADAAAEVEAIGMAIGVLNNDDALQLFNKTDTKDLVQVSLLQQGSKKNTPIVAALNQLSQKYSSPAIAMLAMTAKQALKSGKVDFSKIIKMIDDMVVLLKKEAEDDATTRENCIASFNESEAEKKDAAQAIKSLSAKIEELGEVIKAQAGIITKSNDDIAAAKESMAQASEQRREDNAEFVVAVDLNKQAVTLINKAKNKLNSYYNPQLVPTEAAPELSAEDQLVAGARSVLVQEHSQGKQLPEGQPEVFDGERKNKGQKGSSVIALMDMLINDLEKDTAALEQAEAVAQNDYENLSADLAKQVVDSNKALADATNSKANAEEGKLTAESTLDMKTEELNDINQTIADLHSQCDFILKAFEERKAARETEISGLQKAKAILAGAKFD